MVAALKSQGKSCGEREEGEQARRLCVLGKGELLV